MRLCSSSGFLIDPRVSGKDSKCNTIVYFCNTRSNMKSHFTKRIRVDFYNNDKLNISSNYCKQSISNPVKKK